MRRPTVFLAAVLFLIAAAPGASAQSYADLTGYQWALQQVHAPDAWQVSTGAGVKVGVVDTGADAGHPDFGGRVSSFDCTKPGCPQFNQDVHGHGTHVTGIIAAANDRSGTAGTAPSTQVVVANVFTCDSGACNDPSATFDHVQAGVDFLLNQGVVAINLSLGDGGFSGFLCDNSSFGTLLEGIWQRGAVAVFAAGNCGGGLLGGGADYRGVHALVVGASGPNGTRASYTNDMSTAMWGLLAPGGDGPSCSSDGTNCVLSTWPVSKSGGDPPYYLLQGTSMAAPHVTGAVADLRAKGLSQQGAVDAIMGSLDRISCGGGCQGRLNLQAAVGAPSAPPPTTVTTAGGGFGGAGGTVKKTPTTRSTPRPTAAPTTVVTAPPETTTTEPATTTTEAPPIVRSQALKPPSEDDGVGPLALGLGVLGLIAAAGATGVAAWRNRLRGAGAP